MEHLNGYLDDGRWVTFISDGQKELINAILSTWFTVYHMACPSHIYANFSKSYTIVQLKLWKGIKSSEKHDFSEVMAEINVEKKVAFEWLETKLHCYK